jgi:hypothetical protein
MVVRASLPSRVTIKVSPRAKGRQRPHQRLPIGHRTADLQARSAYAYDELINGFLILLRLDVIF